MTTLFLPAQNKTESNFEFIKQYLKDRGVALTRWEANCKLEKKATQEEILAAYSHEIKPFMHQHGFKSCDVISVYPEMDNIAALREKFLSEHTHSEDEVRFFVEGEGKFWFHLENDEVLCLLCTAGDFLSVPTGIRHWFDLAPKYFVKAIRIFTSKEGWVAQYTDSGVDVKYNNLNF
jgi:1,2-dihydroxy-3-keto-5-methylthiopentene dioxygenase